MKKIVLPGIDINEKDFKRFLKENKVNLKVVGEEWGFTMCELTGKEDNLLKVLNDNVFGWDGDYDNEEIIDCYK
jgi:hypothetical protein